MRAEAIADAVPGNGSRLTEPSRADIS